MSKGNTVQLKANVRDEFTRASRRELRENGGLPGVVYGAGEESIPVAVDFRIRPSCSTPGVPRCSSLIFRARAKCRC